MPCDRAVEYVVGTIRDVMRAVADGHFGFVGRNMHFVCSMTNGHFGFVCGYVNFVCNVVNCVPGALCSTTQAKMASGGFGC